MLGKYRAERYCVKYEDIYLNDYQDVPELYEGLGKYFRFYNHERPHSALGGITPAEAHLPVSPVKRSLA